MTRKPIRRKKRGWSPSSALLHEQLERRLGALEADSPRASSSFSSCEQRCAAAGWSAVEVDAELPRLVEEVGAPATDRRPARAARCRPARDRCARRSRAFLLHRRDVQPALVREGALRRRRPGACWARGWRARRRSATAPPGCASCCAASRSDSRASAAGWGSPSTRLALPQRSPKPLMVPCTWTQPVLDRRERVGDRQLAVVVAVDAERRAGTARCAASTAAPTCAGSAPPRVSHRQSRSAPASAAARRHSSAYSRIGARSRRRSARRRRSPRRRARFR